MESYRTVTNDRRLFHALGMLMKFYQIAYFREVFVQNKSFLKIDIFWTNHAFCDISGIFVLFKTKMFRLGTFISIINNDYH